MVYIWWMPDYYPEELIGMYDRSISPDRFTLNQGESAGECGDVTVNFDCSLDKIKDYDVLPNSSMLPLVNSKVREILNRVAPGTCEYIKATVVAADTKSDQYSIVVVTNKQDLLDRDKSEYSIVPGTTDGIMCIKTLYYNAEDMKYPLLRNTSYLPHILVSQELRDALVDAEVSGLWLPTPEELYP